MFGRSCVSYFVSFLALLGLASAVNSKDLDYRMDFRDPETVRASGGLVAWNPAGTGSVVDHILEKLRKDDPWVSTSKDKDFLVSGASSPGEVYVYYVDISGLESKLVADAFKAEGKPDPHSTEVETVVKSNIPWKNIKA